MHTSTITRVPYGNFIRAVEIYRSLLTNSVNPPTVSFIHNVIRDGNYSGLRRKIIYSLREKSITARRNFSRLDPHGYYSSGYDLLIGSRKLNSALGKSLVLARQRSSPTGIMSYGNGSSHLRISQLYSLALYHNRVKKKKNTWEQMNDGKQWVETKMYHCGMINCTS